MLPSFFVHFSSALRGAPFSQYGDRPSKEKQDQEMETLAGLWQEDPLGRLYIHEPASKQYKANICNSCGC